MIGADLKTAGKVKREGGIFKIHFWDFVPTSISLTASLPDAVIHRL